MNGFQILSQLSGLWFIDPATAEAYMPLVRQMRAGNFSSAALAFKGKKKANAPFALHMGVEPGAKAHQAGKYSSFDEAPAGSIAVIPVSGPMMSQDFCGSLGTQSLGRLLQEADAHPNIDGHVVVFDTPGGTVAGTERFSNIIKSTQKPCVAFVQGMMASAGYWAGCSANHVMMGGQTCQVGSIGTMLTITDSRKAAAKAGEEQITVRADASYDKNEAFLQLLAGNDQPVKDQMLNPLNDVFVGAVQANRAGKLPKGKNAENVLSGKMYLAADAVKLGLADSIGTFDDAVQQAFALIGQNNQTTQPTPDESPNSNHMNLKASWGALLTFFGVAAAAAPETVLTEANLDQLNAKLEEQATALAAADTARATAETALATATETVNATKVELATATAQVTSLTAEVARLGKQPGETPTQAVVAGAETTTVPAKDGIVDAEAAHNVLAAKYFS